MENKLAKIHIEPQATIGKILKDGLLFVPVNQRDFSWKEKNVEDLYRDLQEAMSNASSEYFLGSVVMIKTDDKRMMIVDGQQRLTSSLILIAAIRDYHDANEDQTNARRLEKTFLFSEQYGLDGEIQNLELNSTDNQYFFESIVLPKSDPRRKALENTVDKDKKLKLSHSALKKAAFIAKERVKIIVEGSKPENHFDLLKPWIDFMVDSATVIWVKVPDESSAYVIFETMNDRGLALSATDLIKNYLFSKATNAKLDTVKENWARMKGSLETVGDADIIKTFVRHFWISRYGLVQSAHLFASLKLKVRTSEQAVKFSADLAEAAILYSAIMNPSHSYWNQYTGFVDNIRDALTFLKLGGVLQVRPILLSAIPKFNKKETAELCKKLVSWAIRLIVAGRQGTGELEQVYSEVPSKIFNKEIRTTIEVAKVMLKKIPLDPQFEEDFAQAKVSKAELARWYLRELEIAANPSIDKSLLPNENTTAVDREHIMPVKSTLWTHISLEDRTEYLQRLGNQALILAKDNSTLGNESFEIKKPVLATSKFKLTKEIADYDNWGIEEIVDRQKRLAKIAVKTWKR